MKINDDVIASIDENLVDISSGWLTSDIDVYNLDYTSLLKQPISVEASTLNELRFVLSATNIMIRESDISNSPILWAGYIELMEEPHQIANHNDLHNIQGGSSTLSEYYHLSATTYGYVNSLSASAQTQLLNLSATKADKAIIISAGTGLTGGGTLTTSRTLSLATAGTAGTYTKVTTDAYGRVISGTTLSPSDLPNGIDASKINSGIVSNTEFGYLDGVSANIQIQINQLKVQSLSGMGAGTPGCVSKFITSGTVGNSSIVDDGISVVFSTPITTTSTIASSLLSGNKVLISDSNIISESNISNTSLNYLSGTSADIQSQINTKLGGELRITAAQGLSGGGYLSASPTISLATTGTAGTYTKVTTNAYGQVTTGTTITSADIPQLPATKVGSGNIDNTEFEYLNGTSANIQTQFANISALDSLKALKTTTITAGTGLTGGGDLSSNRTIALATTGTAGTYTKVTTDAYGRVTAGTTLTSGDIPQLPATKVGSGNIDNTEFEYLNGVSANIQTQLSNLSAVKVDKTTTITAGTGLTGGGDLSSNRTISLATTGTAGTYTKVTTNAYGQVTAGTTLTSGDIPTLPTSKIQETTTDRFVSDTQINSWAGTTTTVNTNSADWETAATNSHTHSNKAYLDTVNQSLATTASISAADFYDSGFAGARVLVSNGKNITESSITTTELNFIDNLSANAQTQFANISALDSLKALKTTTITAGTGLTGGGDLSTNRTLSLATTGTAGTYTKITTNNYGQVTAGTTLTSADIPQLPATKIGSGNIDNTEFEYLNGVSANIQTQLNGKVSKTGDSMSGYLNFTNDNTGIGFYGGASVYKKSGTSLVTKLPSGAGDVRMQVENNSGVILGTYWDSGNLPITASHLSGTTSNIQTQLTNISALDSLKALKTTTITAGTGLTGGGDLSTNRTLSLATTGTAGTYTKITTNNYGQVTAGTTLTSADIPTLPTSKIQETTSDRFVSDTQIGQWDTVYSFVNSNSADWELNNIMFRQNVNVGYSRLATFTNSNQGSTKGCRISLVGYVFDGNRRGSFDLYFGVSQDFPMSASAPDPVLRIDSDNNALWSFGYTIDEDTSSAKTYTLWAYNPINYAYLKGTVLANIYTSFYENDVPTPTQPTGYTAALFVDKKVNSLETVGGITAGSSISAPSFRDSNFSGSKVLVSNGTLVDESSITTTKLGYLANVSADIQSLLYGVGYPVRSEYYFNKSGNIASNTYTSSISLPISANELNYGNAPGGTYQYRYKLRASLTNTSNATNYSYSLKLGNLTLGTCSASSVNEHIWFDVDIVPTGATSFDTFGQCGNKTGIFTCPFQVTNTFNPGILNNLYVVTYGAGAPGGCELKKFEIIKYHFNYPLPAGY